MARTERNQRTFDLAQVQHGWDVYGVDGDKIGDVGQVSDGYLVVSKGFFFPRERYVPAAAIVRLEGDRVYLNVTKADLDAERWDNPPRTSEVDVERSRPRAAVADQDARTLELREEQLRATTKPVQAGEVEIRKDVVEEKQTLEVPVTREEVVIERHPVNRADADRSTAGEIGSGETIRIPVREERVELDKQTVVTEEIEVGKRAVQETQRVSGTVRREEAHVEHDDDVDVRHRQANLPHEHDRRS